MWIRFPRCLGFPQGPGVTCEVGSRQEAVGSWKVRRLPMRPADCHSSTSLGVSPMTLRNACRLAIALIAVLCCGPKAQAIEMFTNFNNGMEFNTRPIGIDQLPPVRYHWWQPAPGQPIFFGRRWRDCQGAETDEFQPDAPEAVPAPSARPRPASRSRLRTKPAGESRLRCRRLGRPRFQPARNPAAGPRLAHPAETGAAAKAICRMASRGTKREDSAVGWPPRHCLLPTASDPPDCCRLPSSLQPELPIEPIPSSWEDRAATAS